MNETANRITSECLRSENHLDHGEYRYHKAYSEVEEPRVHYHDYHEVFLTMEGTLLHRINGKDVKLSAGNLVFVRDRDVHQMLGFNGEPFMFLNLAFSSALFCALTSYLGDDFDADALLKCEDAPYVVLSDADAKMLSLSLESLNSIYNDRERSILQVKMLLAEIFVRYFSDWKNESNTIPEWCRLLHTRMSETENFTAGTARMTELSGKSREHIARSFRRYYGISPSDYIASLRLNYAAALLVRTNRSIAEICFEAGYQNVSWFYSEFASRFKLTPGAYRRKLRDGN